MATNRNCTRKKLLFKQVLPEGITTFILRKKHFIKVYFTIIKNIFFSTWKTVGSQGFKLIHFLPLRETLLTTSCFFFSYLPFLNFPAAAPVFSFFFVDPFISGSWEGKRRTWPTQIQNCCNSTAPQEPRWRPPGAKMASACHYLAFGRQRSRDGEEGVQSALSAALAALQDLLTAVTHAVLTVNTHTFF